MNKDSPLVSCIMPTFNRRLYVPRAIEYFLSQDYPDRELIIVDDGTDKIKDLIPRDPRIVYRQLNHKHTIGAKRNLAIKEARGEILAHWDDDDWFAPWRLTYQVEHLLKEDADICGLSRLFFYNQESDVAWEYVYPENMKPWLSSGTFCYQRNFFKKNAFPDMNDGAETRFLWSGFPVKLVALKDTTFYVASIHIGNTSPKRTFDRRWHAYPARAIKDIMGKGMRDLCHQ